jgi:Spy/CpxP family protein refolding chaperone
MISLRHFRLRTAPPLASALALMLAGASGCLDASESARGQDGVEEGAQALAEEGAAPGGRKMEGPRGPHARRPGPPGPEVLLFAALHELELTDAQRGAIKGAIDKIARGPKEQGRVDRPEIAALAAGVRAGKVDTAAVLAKVGGENSAFEEPKASLAGALATLHATLTKEQRSALVSAVSARMEEHGPPGREASRGEGPPGRGPLGFLLHGIELTDAQGEAIQRALEAQRTAAESDMKKRFEAKHAVMSARLQTFAADAFDAKAFVEPPQGARAGGPKGHIEQITKDLAVVAPLLEPAQREALAARLEQGPPAPPPMGPPGEAPPAP